MRKDEITIIICCAGMGTRLGIGTTKALVDICGKPLIIHQLEMLEEYDDIRIVVGYKAEKVIEVVNKYRKDIMYVFNYDFETTGVAASFTKGLLGARKYVVYMDGDLLINRDDFIAFMKYENECIGCSISNSAEPVYLNVVQDNALNFSHVVCEMEWNGIAKIESKRLGDFKEYVYEMIEPLLPLKSFNIRSREIDTPEDYEKMIEWVEGGYC